MKALIPAAILAAVLVSGCTVPGLEFIPQLFPFMPNQQTTAYENDVIVIRELSAVPKEVSSGQTLTLYADVQNVLKAEEKNTGGKMASVKVTVELYDYCPGIFETETQTLKAGPITLNPQETRSFKWTLTAKPATNLQTRCEFKLRASYEYSTQALSTITFMSKAEMDRLTREGKTFARKGTLTIGAGPVKPYLDVRGEQPLPSDSAAQTVLTVRNAGSGYADNINLKVFEHAGLKKDVCEIKEESITLIKKDSSPMTCALKPNEAISVEKTYTLRTLVSYNYFFEKSVLVNVNPK